MHYLVDGYNLLFQIYKKKQASLEEKRKSLLEALSQEISLTSLDVTIVFDSSEEFHEYAQKITRANLEVVYAPRDQTADDYIIEILELTKNPKTQTVITEDSNLKKRSTQIGANILSIKKFISLILEKKRKTTSKTLYKESSSQIERLLKIFEEKLEKE